MPSVLSMFNTFASRFPAFSLSRLRFFSATNRLDNFIQRQLQACKGKPLQVLDLSIYRHNIAQEKGIATAPWVMALQQCSAVQVVKLSGHSELTDEQFYPFIKWLPQVHVIELKSITAEQFKISVHALMECAAKGIILKGDAYLLRYLSQHIYAYVRLFGIDERHAYDMSQAVVQERVLDAQKCRQALENEAKELRNIQDMEQRFQKLGQHIEELKSARLLREYAVGFGFDTQSPWYMLRPTSPKVLATHFEAPECMFALYVMVTKLHLWDELLKFEQKHEITGQDFPVLFAHPMLKVLMREAPELIISEQLKKLVRYAQQTIIPFMHDEEQNSPVFGI